MLRLQPATTAMAKTTGETPTKGKGTLEETGTKKGRVVRTPGMGKGLQGSRGIIAIGGRMETVGLSKANRGQARPTLEPNQVR